MLYEVASASAVILIVPAKKLIVDATPMNEPFNAAPRWWMQPLQLTPLSGGAP